jgi:hypothetical protein
MVDQSFTMNVNETLELDYLIEEISRDTIEITDEPTEDSFSVSYISRETGVFNPSNTGTYKLDIKGQTIEIQVTDIPDSGISRWEFEQDVTDSWGNYDGTDNTTAGYTTDSVVGSYAKSFDGSGDNVNIGESVVGGLSEFSIAVWLNFNLENISEWYFPVAEYKWGGPTNFFLGHNSGSNTVSFDIGGVSMNRINAGKPTAGTWELYTGVYDGTSNADAVRIYRNKTRKQETSADGSAVNTHSLQLKYGETSGGTRQWPGDMDDLRIYDKGLTDTEVSNLYDTGSISG